MLGQADGMAHRRPATAPGVAAPLCLPPLTFDYQLSSSSYESPRCNMPSQSCFKLTLALVKASCNAQAI